MSFDVVDEQLVADARASLQSQPVAEIYYQQFKKGNLSIYGYNDSPRLS